MSSSFLFRLSHLAFILAVSVCAQDPDSKPRPDLRLPNGQLQRDAIVKADHERNVDDAGLLVKLSEELKSDLEKNTEHVLSVTTMKKTEEIEKIAKRIRSRMKRY